MKKITKNTVLKQGDKMFYPEELSHGIYWKDNDSEWLTDKKYVAQSTMMVKNLPIIDLDSYIEGFLLKRFPENDRLHNRMWQAEGWKKCLKESEFQYTQKDIERAIELARVQYNHPGMPHDKCFVHNSTEIIEYINSIKVIEVDEKFNIISYE